MEAPGFLALITLMGVAITALVTWSIAQRRIAVEHVTAERAKWREKVRMQALQVHQAILCGDEAGVRRLKSEFRALLNPFDRDDRELLDFMNVDGARQERRDRADDVAKGISLLLKHDWDRAKLEAGFFLGRWVLDVKRWRLDWDEGTVGERRVKKGMRFYEKYSIRTVRATVLAMVAIALVGLPAWVLRDWLGFW